VAETSVVFTAIAFRATKASVVFAAARFNAGACGMIIARNFGNAGVGVDSLWAYHTLNVFHLIVERLRACRRLMLREKTLVTARLD